MKPDEAAEALGDKFTHALVEAVGITRTDMDEFREKLPGWASAMSNRGMANLIWERLWTNMCARLEGHPEFYIKISGVIHEIHVGLNVVTRLKRHTAENAIQSYPTQGALEFYTQEQDQLPGLESTSLAVGYLWDPELRMIVAPVVSFRDGKDNPIWMMRLDEPAAGVAAIWSPVEPALPGVIVAGDENEVGKETESGA
ncbi:MAG: hypothetical protein Q8M73_12070 [Actinomycetota bacterium]|nr:hypothetical protein [Actinomycetota bacterium]